MADTAISYRRPPQQSRVLVIARWRERIVTTLLVTMVFILSVYTAVNVQREAEKEDIDNTLSRTSDELVAGAKRFVDCYYSVNAATARPDQSCAHNMMLNHADRVTSERNLKQTDFIRLAESAGKKARLMWEYAKVEYKHDVDGNFVVSVNVQMEINFTQSYEIHILVYVEPVEMSDSNSTGVGVTKWVDVAEAPHSYSGVFGND